MENATKAILIAAAVLIAIVLIAGGILLLNSGANSKNQVDKVGQEIGTAIRWGYREYTNRIRLHYK